MEFAGMRCGTPKSSTGPKAAPAHQPVGLLQLGLESLRLLVSCTQLAPELRNLGLGGGQPALEVSRLRLLGSQPGLRAGAGKRGQLAAACGCLRV